MKRIAIANRAKMLLLDDVWKDIRATVSDLNKTWNYIWQSPKHHARFHKLERDAADGITEAAQEVLKQVFREAKEGDNLEAKVKLITSITKSTEVKSNVSNWIETCAENLAKRKPLPIAFRGKWGPETLYLHHNLTRQLSVTASRLRTDQLPLAKNLFVMKVSLHLQAKLTADGSQFIKSPLCPCGQVQDVRHLLLTCNILSNRVTIWC